MILLATVWTTTMKYALHCIDMRRDTPWEAKSIFVFYVELAAGQSRRTVAAASQLTLLVSQTSSSSVHTSLSSA